MIRSCWIENQNGDRLDISLANSGDETGFVIINIEGLGSPTTSINGEGGPGFDGVRANSITVDPRQIIFSLAIIGMADNEEDTRALLYEYFPTKQPITFGIITDRVSVSIDGWIESNELNHFSKIENATISLFFPDPYFTDLVTREILLGTNISVPLFEFPFSNESLTDKLIQFGYIMEYPSARVIYTGSYKTGVTIEMIFDGVFGGDVSDITISNSNGNQKMSIDIEGAKTYFGSNAQNGDRIVINTRPRQKSANYIRAGVSYNLLGGIPITDDWIEIRPGTNYISITAVEGQDNIITTVTFNPKREGV